MDFRFSDEQDMLRDLAREILEKEVSLELLKQVEAEGDGFAPGLWASLAEANLLGLAVPEANGGMGFGFLELCILLGEVGRSIAPAPVLPALVMGGLPIARFGTAAQREEWLGKLASGDLVLSGALVDADSGEPGAPATLAVAQGEGYRLSGRKRLVPQAGRAARIVVPARLEAGVALFLVDPAGPGVTLIRQPMTDREAAYDVELDGVELSASDRIGEAPLRSADLQWLHDAVLLATCAEQVGVSERAIEITAEYTREREQFGAPIGSFPAVQQRLADGFIDLSAMRWTLWRGAWMVSDGQDAMREALVAKFWAADGGSRIASTAQHLHGGLGVDLDYPIHRYFIRSKVLELQLGAATPLLARLGRDLARTGPQEI